jgi:hypothetical protein
MTILDPILDVAGFILDAFWKIWPYLLLTIPLAVAVRMSGVSKYIGRAFVAQPVLAIFLATFVGAFSPFCSCSVIPVIAGLLISGVPLAPVMSFWLASPSMDPEVFLLSAASLGWDLAVWRLAATFVLSLGAGLITHVLAGRGWLGDYVLRDRPSASGRGTRGLLKTAWRRARSRLAPAPALALASAGTAQASATGCAGSCSTPRPEPEMDAQSSPLSFRQRLLGESWSATLMVAKFMLLAFFLEALITLYVPSDWIARILGPDNPQAIASAALLGVPVYINNLAALGLMGGMLEQGMNPAAALAFLVAGPTTTFPAMAAVWGLTTRRVFLLYVAFALVGAVAAGYLYGLVAALF